MILITGGSGFLGRNVKEYLVQKGYAVLAPTSQELDCLNEAAVTEYLKQNHFDQVLHFAMHCGRTGHYRDPAKALENGLRMFLNFSKNASHYGRLFYAGSGAEYDKRHPIVKVTEEDLGRTIPVDQYGLMKYTAGQIIEDSEKLYNLRLFGVYGPYEDYSTKFISNVCCKAIHGMPLSIRKDLVFDYLWVRDFCRIVELFLEHDPRYHTYNIVSGTPISLRQICDIVNEISGKRLPVFIGKEGLGNEYTASNSRFLTEFPDFQFTSLETAVRELHEWYENAEIDLYSILYPGE